VKKRLIVVGIVLLIGLAILMVRQSRNRPEEGVVNLSGNAEVTEVNVGFKLAGKIEKLFTDEGMKINKGDKLAVLDSPEIEYQLAQSKAFLSEAQMKLAELKAGTRPQEIAQARAQLNSAGAELDKAKKDYQRAERLYKNDAISTQQMELEKKVYDVALSRQKTAAETVSLAKEGPRIEQIKASESRVRQAESAVSIAEERMKDTVLVAPLTGVILRKNVEAGEVVSAGTPVFTIGDIENPWVKVYIKEDKLGLVKLNQKAEIATDSYPGRKYQGVVTYISSEAEFTPKNVQTQEERVKLVFGVKVSVKNINDELKPGMPADVKILLK